MILDTESALQPGVCKEQMPVTLLPCMQSQHSKKAASVTPYVHTHRIQSGQGTSDSFEKVSWVLTKGLVIAQHLLLQRSLP